MNTSRTRGPVRVSLLTLVASTWLPATVVHAGGCWSKPVAAAVTDPFREPECRWCPGNRGLEYATTAGTVVRAVAAGTVTFAGMVAGTTYVVVRHADGPRATDGNLEHRTVDVADTVVRGALVGRTAGRFHFGVRDGDTYIDPAPFIGTLRWRTRLIPTDGSPAPPPPPPELVCLR